MSDRGQQLENLKEKMKAPEQVKPIDVGGLSELPKEKMFQERDFLKKTVVTLKKLQQNILNGPDANARLNEVNEMSRTLDDLEKMLQKRESEQGLLAQAKQGGKELLSGTGKIASTGLETLGTGANTALSWTNEKIGQFRAFATEHPAAWILLGLPILGLMAYRGWIRRRERLQGKADAVKAAEGGRLSFKRHPFLWAAGILGIIGAGTYAYGGEKAQAKMTSAAQTAKATVSKYMPSLVKNRTGEETATETENASQPEPPYAGPAEAPPKPILPPTDAEKAFERKDVA